MNNRVKFAALGLLLALNSCMVGPKYARPTVQMPLAFKEEPPAGWKQAQPDDAAVRGKWWTVYNDSQLNALEDQISISNQNVLAAEAQFREAQAAVSIARSQLFPTVSAGPSGTASQTGNLSVKQSYAMPIGGAYSVDIWGGIRRTVRANSDIAQASAADLQNATLLYQAELAEDYFQVQGLEAQAQLLSAAIQSYEQYLQVTKNRYSGGISTMGDVSLAETQLETVRAQLTDLGVQRAQFEHAIAVLTGKPPSELSISIATRQAPPPVVSVGLPSSLLERRPDIAAAERQVAAANEQIGVAKSAFFPSLILSGSVASELMTLLTAPTTFWSLGPQMLGTIFDGGKRRAQVKQTEATYDETVARYRQTVLTALQQVEDGLSDLRILADEANDTDRAVKAAQQSLDISTHQYRSGINSYLQVITSQTANLQNQRAAAEILTRRMLASVSLIQALGGGWDGRIS